MVKLQMNAGRGYLSIEFAFLFFISFMITLISDLEYSSYEQHDISRFAEDIGYRLISGSFDFLTYGLLYWGFLKRYVLHRNILAVVICLTGFVFFDHLFDKYAVNWVIVDSNFVSADIRARTLSQMNNPQVYFPINYLLISAIFPLLGLALLVRTLHQNDELKAVKEQQLSSELNYLKAQLHPHFFFNTLNNIYGLALGGSGNTAPMIAKLGEMMRYILYEASRPQVLLSREIEFLSDYASMEGIRHGKNITICLDIQGVEPGSSIEPLLLLPFVENAFKHGLEQETGNGRVSIVLCQTEKELVLEVVNSKPTSSPTESAKGIGIANVINRLDILYPSRYQLDITDKDGQYRVTLTLQTTP
ncbi:MAG: hypothetical protein EOP45_00795 [Sphingobacteriaceae bacterium]|nr:MAG: hypothetical protein EOP45_00795 [Sphingobacteriaceae bacterium]